MNNVDTQYLQLAKKIINTGVSKEDRTGVGTVSLFGESMKFDMSEGFPILTSKYVWFKGVLHELIWFLRGDTTIQYLLENDVNFWNDNAFDYHFKNSKEPLSYDEFIIRAKEGDYYHEGMLVGSVGKAYGYQWRSNGVDQIQRAIDMLKNNPDSRRIVVSAWNPNDINECALPPCHNFFQFYTSKNKKGGRNISLMFNMRSNDFFLGNPFNVASYALLLEIFGNILGYTPDKLTCVMGDVHIYSNHIDAIKSQMGNNIYHLPKLKIKRKLKSIDEIKYDDFELVEYEHGGRIKAKMAV